MSGSRSELEEGVNWRLAVVLLVCLVGWALVVRGATRAFVRNASAPPMTDTVIVQEPVPYEAPLSAKLAAQRWPCKGTGCADSAAIVRIADEIEWQAKVRGIDANLLAAVLMVEDPWLDSTAVSYAGAIGLMQVMPFHAGAWGPLCGDNLQSITDNICTGAAILEHILKSERNKVRFRTLQRYNGCNCTEYPERVAMALEALR